MAAPAAGQLVRIRMMLLAPSDAVKRPSAREKQAAEY
jgi:hypothetical protein